MDKERERLRAKVVTIHENSRRSTGNRTIAGKLRQEGEEIGRYKTRRLMGEAKLTTRQP